MRYNPIEIWSVPMNLSKKVEVKTRAGIFQAARILEKPVLSIPNAKITQMGIEGDETYNALIVLDGDLLYMYRKKVVVKDARKT